jgi:hypothetical protein
MKAHERNHDCDHDSFGDQQVATMRRYGLGQMLSDLTDPAAVRSAIAEYDDLGRDQFLAKYRFRKAHRYFLLHDGREYDSKAIAGVAYGVQHSDEGSLRPGDFSGGEAAVLPVLERLGFTVIDHGSAPRGGGDLSSVLSDICTQLEQRETGSTDWPRARFASWSSMTPFRPWIQPRSRAWPGCSNTPRPVTRWLS